MGRSRARGGGGGGGGSDSIQLRFSRRKVVRTVIVLCLCLIGILPPILFHLRMRLFDRINCGWLPHPPLVCAHGGDSYTASPNTVCYAILFCFACTFTFISFTSLLTHRWLHISLPFTPKLTASRSTSLVPLMVFCLLSTTGRDLQLLSGNTSSKVGHFTSTQIRELSASLESVDKLNDQSIPTIQDALTLTANSVRQIILDIKVGPPFYEKGLARDILSIVEETECQNCLIWCKSDSLVRDVIKLSSEIMVGYIVMKEPSTGARTNLLRMKGAEVVGVYHQLIDEKLMRVLHRRNKKVYAWTVDDVESMQRMLFEHVDAIITGNPTLLQRLMQDTRTQCLEEGYSLPH